MVSIGVDLIVQGTLQFLLTSDEGFVTDFEQT